MDQGLKIMLSAFGIFAAAVLLFYLLITFREKKRTSAIIAFAQSMGFLFLGEESNDSVAELQRLLFENTALFEKGWGQKCKNILHGVVAGLQTSIFDYSYTTGRGRGARTWRQTVFAFTQDLSLPAFDLKPEGLMDRIGDAFTHSDIDFDSYPEFSRRYFLRSPRKERILELFTPELITYLQGLPPEPKWHIAANSKTVYIYIFNRKVAPEDIRSFAQDTSSIATSFLRYCGTKA